MKKLLSLSALALVLSGCSTGTGGGSKPVDAGSTTTTSVSETTTSKVQLDKNKFDTVLKNLRSHFSTGYGGGEAPDVFKYTVKNTDRGEYLLVLGDYDYTTGKEIDTLFNPRYVKIFFYNKEKGAVEKVDYKGRPMVNTDKIQLGTTDTGAIFDLQIAKEDKDKIRYVSTAGGKAVGIYEGQLNGDKIEFTEITNVSKEELQKGTSIEWLDLDYKVDTKVETKEAPKQESKDSNGLSSYAGTYTGDNGSITLNADGSITDGGQTHKATETSAENGVIHIISNLNVGGMPVVFHVYQDRIEKDSKGGLVVYRKGGSSAKPSQKPTTELQTIPGGGLGRESADTGVSLGTKTVLPGAGVVIRQSPTTNSRVLGNLKQGARVNIGESVTNSNGETWITILENGTARGYIRGDLLG